MITLSNTMELKKTTRTKDEWQDFPISVGIRVRLTNDQKLLIKDAYDSIAAGEVPPTSEGRGGIKVVNNTAPGNLIKDFGADRLTLSHLLASSERHPVGMLRRWERVLGITLLDKQVLTKAFGDYLTHLGFE